MDLLSSPTRCGGLTAGVTDSVCRMLLPLPLALGDTSHAPATPVMQGGCGGLSAAYIQHQGTHLPPSPSSMLISSSSPAAGTRTYKAAHEARAAQAKRECARLGPLLHRKLGGKRAAED